MPVIIVFCWAIGFYLVGLVFFEVKRIDISLAKKVSPNTKKHKNQNEINRNEIQMDRTTSKSILTSSSSDEIFIDLQDIYLEVKLTKIFQFKERKFVTSIKTDILRSVNATFQPNSINAIMGPSGSGKTSLLNLISGRIDSNIFTRFSSSGQILFNQQPVTESMFKSICCYVSQDDNHLLPNLTVYETLSYSARLRLSGLPREEIEERVSDLISDLGLKNCANTLIGNDFVKGISGGEKRRVSIGIQLLTNPSILLLDEPTSGLDSFTSSTIIELLSRLCLQGKTIILTIHQPRAELFKDFGNVLLLSLIHI